MYYQRNRSKTMLHVLAALLLSAAMAAAAIPGLCDTGFSNNTCTGLVPIGGTDGNWQIAFPYPTAPSSSPIPNPCAAPQCGTTGLTFEPAWVDAPDPSWLKNNKASEWITPQVENNLGGHYVYAITVPVPTGDGHVTIVGQLLSDNEVEAIYLSSGATECLPVAGYPYDNAAVNSASNFTTPWTTFKITNAPVSAGGSATLYFVVRNRGVGGVDSNSTDTGLRVQFSPTASTFLP